MQRTTAEGVLPKQRYRFCTVGQQTIFHGDGTDEDLILAATHWPGGECQKATLVLTDPPYQMPGIRAASGMAKTDGRITTLHHVKAHGLDNFEAEYLLETLPLWFPKNTMNALLWCNKDLLADYLMGGKLRGWAQNVLIGQKPSVIPFGGGHWSDVEYIVHLRKNATWVDGTGGYRGRVLPMVREPYGGHPTPKPVDLLMGQMALMSREGDLVVDPFCGTGSTLVACHRMGRRGIGIEKDAHWFEVACQRLEEEVNGTGLFHSAMD